MSEKPTFIPVVVYRLVAHTAMIETYGVVRGSAGPMMRVKREDAERLFADSMNGDVRRLRNYELEKLLGSASKTTGPFVIDSWCPINGVYCAWADCAPEAELREMIANPFTRETASYLTECLKKRGLSV